MKFVFLGPPGAGKGTQADYISEDLSIEHISTGELLRQEISRGTALGKKARSFVESGELVPDDIVIEIIKEHFSEDAGRSFILDGFPRNRAQAVSLEEHGIDVNKVFFFDVSEKVVIERLGGRLYCPVCKKFYHKDYRPPVREGVCDSCGGDLMRRADDEPASIENRLKVYMEKTHPLIRFYEEKGVLEHINGDRPAGEIRRELNARITG